ncbi:MAG: transporter, family, 3-phenylpropionic acid transporter, partial [Alphaproteobacteria bacterium]|jgi:PPP family 3-phenylpropionic acid transporter|nr:transporter, family, 3-phenylpropionic acid transporter [Alphaproteobacteria bacterium]
MAAAPQFSTDRFALKLGLFYAAYFFFGGVQLPFFPLWLEARGLDARTIGMVIAVPTLVRIVATPIITHAADRHRALKAALSIGAVVGFFGMTVVGLVDGPIAILAAFTVAMVALSPMLSLSDAYALSGLGARGRSYGPVRLWGSVAFIAGNVGAGFILEALAPGHLIWLIVFALVLVVAAAAALAPLDGGAGPAEVPSIQSPKVLLRNPAFLAVVLASSMVQGSHALYYGFSTMDWRAAGLDGPVIGLLWGLGVSAEIVLFALSGRLPKSLRPTALLAIGAVGAIVRWTAMAFDPPAALLPALQILHAASFGAAHLGMMGFLARAVPRELAATAQGFAATWSGIVNASATFASGFLYAASGSLAYLAMAAMALAGLASALYAGRLWRD